jgi:hypothetical protein
VDIHSAQVVQDEPGPHTADELNTDNEDDSTTEGATSNNQRRKHRRTHVHDVDDRNIHLQADKRILDIVATTVESLNKARQESNRILLNQACSKARTDRLNKVSLIGQWYASGIPYLIKKAEELEKEHLNHPMPSDTAHNEPPQATRNNPPQAQAPSVNSCIPPSHSPAAQQFTSNLPIPGPSSQVLPLGDQAIPILPAPIHLTGDPGPSLVEAANSSTHTVDVEDADCPRVQYRIYPASKPMVHPRIHLEVPCRHVPGLTCERVAKSGRADYRACGFFARFPMGHLRSNRM